MIGSKTSQVFLWDTVLSWLCKKAVQYKAALTSSMVLGFLAYAFSFTNKLVNHDEVNSLFSKGGTVTSGRWFLGMLDSIFPNVSMPWIYGVITIALISISVCMIISMFRIRNKLLQCLLAGSIIVFPSLTGIFTFMFTSSSYGLAFLLAVGAVWLVARWNRWTYPAALALMILSLAIYQGFVSLAAGLLVLMVMKLLMDGEPLPSVIGKGVVSLLFLILSLGIYFLSTKVVGIYLGAELSSYASSRIAFNVLDLPSNILLAYDQFSFILEEFGYGLIPTPLSQKLHLVMLICCAGMLVLWLAKQSLKDWGRILLLAVMILLLPLAINCMYLFADISAIHTLTLYGFVTVYVLVAMLADGLLTKGTVGKIKGLAASLCLNVLPLCLAVVIAINIYLANITSLHLYLRYENAYAFYTALAADIKVMPEFNQDSRLAVIGSYQVPSYYWRNFATMDPIMGSCGFVPSDYSNSKFLEYYLDFNIPVVSAEEADAIQQTPEFQQMPCYPYYGSMQWFENTLVVKLS